MPKVTQPQTQDPGPHPAADTNVSPGHTLFFLPANLLGGRHPCSCYSILCLCVNHKRVPPSSGPTKFRVGAAGLMQYGLG